MPVKNCKKPPPFFSHGDGTDIGYSNVRDAQTGFCADGREFTECLSPHFAPYADFQFLREAKNDFSERFWKMYLGCTLLDCGLEIDTPGDEGPDLFATIGRKSYWFAATAPSGGAGPGQVPEPIEGKAAFVPEDRILLRLTEAIEAKRLHFEKAEDKGIVPASEGVIVCINGRGIPHSISDYQPHRIVSAVFPIGNERITIDRETLEVTDTGFEHRPHVTKTSETKIPMTGFLDDELRTISAVIYSRVDCANHPRRMGDDFICVHNPRAEYPLPIGFLGRGIEYWAEGNTLRWLEHNIDRNLLARCGHRLRTSWALFQYLLRTKKFGNVES